MSLGGSVLRRRNYINGKFVAPLGGKYLPNTNPATNEIISEIARSDASDVALAIKAAADAYPKWRKTPMRQRAKLMNDIGTAMRKRRDEFAMAETCDMGKPYAVALAYDLEVAINHWFNTSAGYLESTTDYFQMDDGYTIAHRDSIGVCGLISPWNFPLCMMMEKLVPAIMCGNTCVIKPTEMAPTSCSLLCELFDEVGLPPGVVNLVHGYGKEAGEPICTDETVRAISFTGGTATGTRIAQLAAASLKKIQLELGGKNPSVVFDDCYFDETVQTVALSAFSNSGQVCTAGSRVFIESSIYDKFVAALVEHTKNTYLNNVGDPTLETTALGPLVSLAHRKKVESYIELAQTEGGTIVLGGKRPSYLKPPFTKGSFVLPTIIEGLHYTARCATEEIFGPVLTLHKFDTIKEVIKMCNYVNYGLAAAVFTSDIRKGNSVAREIEAGTLWINCWAKFDHRQPFGGVKKSGINRQYGDHSINFFTEPKAIVSQL